MATGWGLSLLVDHRVERKNGRGVFDAALNDAAAIYRNVVLSKIRQAASDARENVLSFSRIECWDGPAQSHLPAARGAPHRGKLKALYKVLGVR